MEFKTNIGIHEMDTQIEFKQEPDFVETASVEVKYESAVTHASDDHIKSELPSFASVFIVQSDSEVHEEDHEIGIKAEMKEEPVWLEGTLAEMKSDSHRDLRFETEDNNAEGEEFLLPETARLDTKDSLKLGENSSPCHEKLNTTDGGDITNRNDKTSHKCKFCGRCFNLASGLQMHVATHESKRIFKCDKCDKTFTTASSLNAHILIFEAKKQHQCNICNKSFHTATSLKRHNLIHEVERPIKV